MTTIADIFDLPERVRQGDFVLRLTEGVERAEQNLGDYVVTEQLARCFDDALSLIGSAVTTNTSKGAYLHGSFGSGKSHFMAVLTLLLRDDPGARPITELAGAGAKVTGGSGKGTTTILKSSGGTFAEGATHLRTCVVYATISETDTDLRSACTMTDASGDTWFAVSKRSLGDIDGGGGAGQRELIGGTGKYTVVSGTCSCEVDYLPDNFVITTSDCTGKK